MPRTVSSFWLLPVALGAAALAGAGHAGDPAIEVARMAGSYAAASRIVVELAPAAVGDDGRIPSLDVTLTLDDVRAAAGEPLLCLPLVTVNVDTVATTLSIIESHDARGPFTLAAKREPGDDAAHDRERGEGAARDRERGDDAAHDRESGDGAARDREGGEGAARDSGSGEGEASEDAPGAGEPTRCWSAGRPVRGDVAVRYAVPVLNATGTRGAAPPIELRSESGGVSGGGATFLMMPPGDAPRRFAVRWDLSALPDGAHALSSYGAGDVAIEEALPPARFTDAYFMAGAIGHFPGRYPVAGATQGFFGAWQGTPPFDAPSLMQRGETLYASYLEFFRPPDNPPFGVFLRRNPVNPGGGMGLNHSFILTFGPETDSEGLNGTLAHEMFHVFVGSLDAPSGLAGSWFGEGLAVHYQRLMLLRTGQITPDEFLESVNSTAARYYTNALIDTPNDEIPARFWEDTRVRVLPYDRGSMYFAALDPGRRRRPDRRRSLDDLLLAMLELRRSGRPMDQSAWVRQLDQELGSIGVAGFEAMLAGEVVLPAPDAFGPCFTRTQKPLRRYQLGFEPKVLTESPRIVRGLIAGSAAALAGLQNGDEILKPVPQDGIQGDQEAFLTLDVQRGDRPFTVRYRPRGETVDAWQWKRVDDVPDAECAW